MVATLTTTISVKPTKWSNTVKQADELVCWCFQEGQKMKTLDRSGLKIRIYNEIFINETLRDLVLFIQFKNMKNAHGGKLLLVKLH